MYKYHKIFCFLKKSDGTLNIWAAWFKKRGKYLIKKKCVKLQKLNSLKQLILADCVIVFNWYRFFLTWKIFKYDVSTVLSFLNTLKLLEKLLKP